jgi:hypothetical protein
MLFCPFLNHGLCPAWKSSTNYLERLNIDLRFMLGVSHMKMRRRMIPEEHLYPYPVKYADCWLKLTVLSIFQFRSRKIAALMPGAPNLAPG